MTTKKRTKAAPSSHRLTATLFMTLDGVVESPHEWSFPYWDDEVGRFKHEELRASEALLLGRVTYEAFAKAWPGRTDETGFADRFNAMPKYVASRTLTAVSWTNSHLLEGELPGAVAALKRSVGGDVVLHGSVGLIDALLPHDLIDRFHLLVYPLVLGKGRRLFESGVGAKFRLVETRAFPKGVVAMIYDRAPSEASAAGVANPIYDKYEARFRRSTRPGGRG